MSDINQISRSMSTEVINMIRVAVALTRLIMHRLEQEARARAASERASADRIRAMRDQQIVLARPAFREALRKEDWWTKTPPETIARVTASAVALERYDLDAAAVAGQYRAIEAARAQKAREEAEVAAAEQRRAQSEEAARRAEERRRVSEREYERAQYARDSADLMRPLAVDGMTVLAATAAVESGQWRTFIPEGTEDISDVREVFEDLKAARNDLTKGQVDEAEMGNSETHAKSLDVAVDRVAWDKRMEEAGVNEETRSALVVASMGFTNPGVVSQASAPSTAVPPVTTQVNEVVLTR
jgi:hypothetical protein